MNYDVCSTTADTILELDFKGNANKMIILFLFFRRKFVTYLPLTG